MVVDEGRSTARAAGSLPAQQHRGNSDEEGLAMPIGQALALASNCDAKMLLHTRIRSSAQIALSSKPLQGGCFRVLAS